MDDGPPDELRGVARRLQSLCVEHGLTVATAESCTGGLVVSTLTDVPDSSAYVLGGIVAYADRIKTTELDVPTSLIADHGAVSAQVARAMAVGARARFGSTLAVAVTGIAGPGGGSVAKPVGLTYVAVAGPAGVEARRNVWTGNRLANKAATVGVALELLVDVAQALAAAGGEETGARDPSAGAAVGR